jgi:Ni/Co efflux regulator RcnB
MKRAALGALLISLVAGSAAMAGTVLPPTLHNGGHNDRGDRGHEQHRPDNRNDNRGRHDNDRRNDRGGNWSNNNRRDDHRWDGRRDDRRWDHDRNNHRWDNDRRWNGNRHYDGRFDNRRYVSPPRYSYSPPHHSHRWENGRWHWGSYYRPYGYAPRYWRRGDRLPVAYYGPRYVIGNYYDCGLRAPPYGYHWVRVDHDVVLAAIATGVVLDVIYNQFW